MVELRSLAQPNSRFAGDDGSPDPLVRAAIAKANSHTGYIRALVALCTARLLLPIVAGLGYEALKALAHANSPLTRALRWPGMQLQRLTTKPPTEEMLEVAIAALNAALTGLPEGEVTKEGYVILPRVHEAAQSA